VRTAGREREIAVGVRGQRGDSDEEVHVRPARPNANVGAAKERGTRVRQQNSREKSDERQRQIPSHGGGRVDGEDVRLDAEVARVQRQDVPRHDQHREKAADDEPLDRFSFREDDRLSPAAASSSIGVPSRNQSA